MKKYIFNTSVFLSSLIINAQVPTIQWQKSFGGTGGDVSHSIIQTSDGGYIVAGYSSSIDGDLNGNHGGKDYWIVKMNNTGAISWQKNFGGSLDEEANSIQQTSDGGYIVAGYSKSVDGDITTNQGIGDYWIIKITSNGTLQWQKCYGGSGYDIASSIKQTSDGGYVICGTTGSSDGDVTSYHSNNDYWIVKIDNTGTIQWQKALGGSGLENATSIQITVDGGYIVGGSSASSDGDVTGNHGLSDYWVVKLNNAGTIQWKKCYGGTGIEAPMAIQQTTDGGFVLSGYTMSNDGDVTGYHGPSEDWWVIKTNNLGILQWEKVIGGTSSEISRSITQISDGGYILTGTSASTDFDFTTNIGCRDVWIVKVNSLGAILWKKGVGASSCDDAASIIQTLDGGCIVAAISGANDGDVTGNHGGSDYWIVKLSSVVGIEENTYTDSIIIYPNPNIGQFNFAGFVGENTVEIFDITGRLIFKTISKNKSLNVDLRGNNKGIYFYKITNPNKWVQQGKLLIQ